MKREYRGPLMQPGDHSFDHDAAQAAWLYYVGNLSQQEVSDRLGISRFKVLRMLADERERGFVKVSVEHRTSRTLELSESLQDAFGLTEAQVAPNRGGASDEKNARDSVGLLAARYISRVAGHNKKKIIGVGWGRTLSFAANNVNGIHNPNLTFVSLMGSITYASETAPGDVCVRLASQTGGRAVLMPAPFIADTPEDCQSIMSQRLVREAANIAHKADHAFMSVGECKPGSILYESGIFTDHQKAQLRCGDVVGDCCGVFYRADGSIADVEVNDCAPCLKPSTMKNADTVLLAGGVGKAVATLAVLRAKFVKRLFVDEELAIKLLEIK